jgi:hypothetical protein
MRDRFSLDPATLAVHYSLGLLQGGVVAVVHLDLVAIEFNQCHIRNFPLILLNSNMN